VSAEGDDDRLLLGGEDGRHRLFGPGRQVGHRGPAAPLRDGLLVDTMTPGEGPQALLTMLDRATDRLCRGGAAVENLAHSASFHSRDKNAPSKPDIKHLIKPLAMPMPNECQTAPNNKAHKGRNKIRV